MSIEITKFERVERTWGDKVRNTLANFFTFGFWKEWKNQEFQNALKSGNYDAANHAIVYGADRMHVFHFIDSPEKISFALAQIKKTAVDYKFGPWDMIDEIVAEQEWNKKNNNVYPFPKRITRSKGTIANFLIKIYKEYLQEKQNYLFAKVAFNLLEDFKIIKLEDIGEFYKRISKMDFHQWKSCPYGGSLEAYHKFIIEEGF